MRVMLVPPLAIKFRRRALVPAAPTSVPPLQYFA
jgi:hypothetical protein